MKNTPKKKVVIAAGGTGGHMVPATALAKNLESLDEIGSVVFMGDGLSTNPYFQKEEFTFHDIASGKMSLKKPKDLFLSCIQIVKGIFKAILHLKKQKPDIIIGFGSYHSFSTLVASRLFRIPYVLYESNLVLGRVNRLFYKSSKILATQFPLDRKSYQKKSIIVKTPLTIKKIENKASSRRYYKLDENTKTLLVFGGSQGSKRINETTLEMLRLFDQSNIDLQCIHILGKEADIGLFKKEYKRLKLHVCVKSFETKMQNALFASDLVISRAGAISIGEQIACSLPSILIPYPFAKDNHQEKNANYMQKIIKGSCMIREEELSPVILLKKVETILDPGMNKLKEMQDHLNAYNAKDKGELLCELIQKCIHERKK